MIAKWHIIIVFLFFSVGTTAQSSDNVALNQYDHKKADSLRIFCQGHLQSFNYFSALPCLLNLLDQYEQREDKTLYFRTKVELAWVYLQLGFRTDASNVLNEAETYFLSEDSDDLARVNLFQSWVLLDLDEIENARSRFENISSRLAQRMERKDQLPYLITKARLLAADSDSLDAKNTLEEANKICLREDMPDWYPFVQYYKGLFAIEKDDVKEASKAFLKSAKVSKELGNAFQYQKALDKLIPLLGERGYYDQAYFLQEERQHLVDSLNELQRQEMVARQIVRYESNKKQKAILDLEGEKRMEEIRSRRSNLTNYALMISFLAVLVAAYLIITFYQQKLASNQIISSQTEQINQQKFTELRNKMQIESMQSMMQGQELERERVAKDLHDSLGGMLSAIKLRFDGVVKDDSTVNLDEFQNVTDLLDDACQEVRNISNNLQPGALEQLGLIEALTDLIGKYERGGQTEIHFQHYGILGKQKFDSFLSLNVYRIIQELLNNSLKHAQASEILVQLHRDDGQLVVMVEDDGKGYDPKDIKEGMGSENVRSRANFLSAELNIESRKGEGTSTMISIPLDQ